MENLNSIWSQFLNKIENIINDQLAYQTFYQPSKLVSLEQQEAKILVDSEFAKVFLNNQKDMLEPEFNLITSGNYQIRFVTENDLSKKVEKSSYFEYQDNLLTSLDFDGFVVGASNKIAHAASVAVSYNPGNTYNPLFIFGNSGLGKTHLLNSIGNHIKKTDKSKNILYIPCDTFVNEYVTAIKNS